MKQTQLFDYFNTVETRKRYGRTTHGGVRAKGHRKLERPLSSKKWIHLVLKSDKAKGALSFRSAKNKLMVERLLREKARRFGVTIAEFVNVGNHLHFQNFLKSVTTLLARKITGARRGQPFGRFWQGLAFTRVLQSSKEELNLRGYFAANREEAQRGYMAREICLEQFNQWVYREPLIANNC